MYHNVCRYEYLTFQTDIHLHNWHIFVTNNSQSEYAFLFPFSIFGMCVPNDKTFLMVTLILETGWDSLEHRRSNHRLIFFFKMVNKEVPPYLKNLVPPRVHQVSQRQLRSSSNCQTPSARTNFIPKFFHSKNFERLEFFTHVTSNPSLQELKRYLDKDKVKVPQYFYYLEDRRCQILHSRLRLGCSSLNSDLFKNHLSKTDVCTCGKPETAEHYFLECNKYITARAETI